MTSLLSQLEKEQKGVLTTMLMLSIIFQKEKAYGYEIKKEMKTILNSESYISESTLYTKLKELSKMDYIDLERDSESSRKYFRLTSKGKADLFESIDYYLSMTKNYSNHLNNLKNTLKTGEVE